MRLQSPVLRATLLLIVLLAPILIGSAPALANYREVRESTDTIDSRSTSFIAPAVGERSDGSLVGVGMEVETTVRSGTGGVFLDTRPLTQLDMQGSARLAAVTAASIAGADFSEHDFVMKVRSSTTAVGGPSAGGAMTVGFTALLLDLPLRDDVVMTGMINPDGSIGPVGGIIQKAEAAHKEGANKFLIPAGQGTVRHVERVVQDDGPFPTVTEEQSQVDVAQYADDKWGMEVIEVEDLHDAFRYMTDHRLERPQVPDVSRSPVFDEVMGEAATGQLEEADSRYAKARSELESGSLQSSDPQAHNDLSEILDRAQSRLELAHDAVDDGAPYTASSRAFQASVEISRVEVWLHLLEGDPVERFARYRDNVTDSVEDAVVDASDAKIDQVVLLEVVGAAQVRAAEALRLLDRSQQAFDEGQLSSAVESLAFARERDRSVGWWLSMGEQISKRVDSPPLEADPRRLANEYRQVAREATTYADVLSSQIGGGEAQSRLMSLAESALRDSQRAQDEGLDAGALYLAVESQVAAHAALSLLGSQDLITDRLDRQRDAALLAMQEARGLGLEPFLAASFREFAQALRGEDQVSALLLYGNAAMIAGLSAALVSGDGGVFGIGSGGGEAPLVTRVGFAGQDPWTGYFALATIVFGFMAGILVTLIVVQGGPRPKPTQAQERLPQAVLSRRGAARVPAFTQAPINRYGTTNGHGASQGVVVPVVRPERDPNAAYGSPRRGLK